MEDQMIDGARVNFQTADASSYIYRSAANTIITPRLNAALAKAQGEMSPAKKDSVNPFFSTPQKKSTYADLAAIIEVIRKPFADNGIAFVQLISCDATGVSATTRLLHSSGEQIESTFWVPLVKKDPQGYGSASTYARRFGLQSIAGVAAEEDDDGNSHAVDPTAKTVKDYTKPVKPEPITVQSAGEMFALQIIATADSLGSLEDAIDAIKKLPAEEQVRLREPYAAKKKLLVSAKSTIDAKTVSDKAAEMAAAQSAARAQIDATMAKLEAPTFDSFIDRIRAETIPANVTLIVAEAVAAKLAPGDLKGMQRTAADRILVLEDAAKQALVKRDPLDVF